MSQLLAKSPSKDRVITTSLVDHSREVVQAAEVLLLERREVLKALGVLGIGWDSLLNEAVLLACWLHDIGKANDFFQGMLLGRNHDNAQPLTHEIISGFMALDNDFRNWLSDGGVEPAVYYVAVAAAMGHHRRWSDTTQATDAPVPMKIERSHQDFIELMGLIGERFGLKPPMLPTLWLQTKSDENRTAYGTALLQMKRELRKWFRENAKGDDERKIIAATKATTIAADVCASAVRSKHYRRMWNEKFLPDFMMQLLDVGLTKLQFRQVVANWAYKNIPGETPPKNWDKITPPKSFEPRPFQVEVANSPSNITLAQAGCGSGKSLAAYMWARQRMKLAGADKIRLIFTLPTTGTASEHYRDYALESGIDEKLTAISHSRSVVDLAYEENGADALYEHRARIESLELWGTALTVCTVDTILGLMVNQRKALYSFPAIVKSAIVFDEVHAYDDVMFGHLLIFIKHFTGLPILLMTASLPPERLDAIREVRPDLNVVHGDRCYEEMKRYSKLELTYPVQDDKLNIVEHRIRDCLKRHPNAKILWVRNQVGWANQTYQACLDLFGDVADVDLYHSRYRYKDRVQIHRRVIDRFNKSEKPSILVATQVAEMSLNLSAHLLITDACDIPGVIQRMGRCNRGAPPQPAPAGHVVVCRLPSYAQNKMNFYPYSEPQVNDCVRWVQELELMGPLSQKDLSDTFERYRSPAAVNLQDAELNALFFRQTWETTVGSFRDPNPTVTILLEDDYNDFMAAGEGGGSRDAVRMWMREHETNVVSRAAVNGWRRYNGVPIAPANAITYGDVNDPDPKRRTGAEWAV